MKTNRICMSNRKYMVLYSILFLVCIAMYAGPQTVHAQDQEGWVYYATDGSNAKHYYNAESMKSALQDPNDKKSLMVLVWDKRVPADLSNKNERELLVLNELNCQSRTYRLIEGDAGYARITQPTTRTGIEHGSWRETLLNTVCKQKKEWQ